MMTAPSTLALTHLVPLAKEIDENKVTPGALGFIVFAVIGGAVWLLMKSMNKHMNRVDFEETPENPGSEAAEGASEGAPEEPAPESAEGSAAAPASTPDAPEKSPEPEASPTSAPEPSQPSEAANPKAS